MTRNIKALGLAVIVVLVIGAVGSVDGALAHDFGGEVDPVVLTGSGSGTYGVKAGALEVKCTKSSFGGTVLNLETEEVTVHPTYSECNAAPFGASPVHTEGCDYILHGNTTEHKNTSGVFESDAAVDIECTSGSSIKVTAPGCTITIPSQTGRLGVTYDNEGPGTTRNLKVTATVDKIKYTTPGGFVCSLGGLSSSGEESFFTGTLTLKGYKDLSGSPSPHQDAFTEGGQVGIWVGGEPSPDISFHSEFSHTTLIGEAAGSETFLLNAGTAECSEAGYRTTIASSTLSEVTVSPEYAGCTAFGFSSTEVKPNGCAYVLHASKAEAGNLEGSADIECPEGQVIEIIAKSRGLLKCTVTIPGQSGLASVTYTNGGTGISRDFKADFALAGVKYSQHIGEGLGKCENGSFENGKINGSPTFIGESAEKKQVGIWVE